LEGYNARPPGSSFSWDYLFYGSLPGASSILTQNISQTSSTTNGLEFAALFNERDDVSELDDSDAYSAITNAVAGITSWPVTGGGVIQWSTIATNVNKNAGSVTVQLVRSGANISTPVKVSFTTYGLTAGSSNYASASGIVTFAAGVTSHNVTVPILNDGVIDPPRQFSLELISASGGAWLGDNLSSVVTIVDTNSPPQFIGQPSILPNGNFQAQLMCNPGLVVTVQCSTNLINWQPMQTFTNNSPVTTITGTNTFGHVKTFYRAVVP